MHVLAVTSQLCQCLCCCCAAIEERISAWTLLPVHNGEGLQVLRYGPGQRYDAHWVSSAVQQQQQQQQQVLHAVAVVAGDMWQAHMFCNNSTEQGCWPGDSRGKLL
jgi:hypothetical protein